VCADVTPVPRSVGEDHVSACWLHASELTEDQREPLVPATAQVPVPVSVSVPAGSAGEPSDDGTAA
jgi:hypothetical protein